MNVLYTCDDNFIWIAGISMYSLFENNKSMQKIHVYLLGDNVSDENKQLLNGIADKYHQDFDAIDVPKLAIPPALISQRWPRSAFTRLYSAQILPLTVEKVLYLDCDYKYNFIKYPNSKYTRAIKPVNEADVEKMMSILNRMREEDPTWVIEQSKELKQTLVHGQGEFHLRTLKWRLENNEKLPVKYEEPKIPYRETITKAARADYRHKKQSGGAGQFGEVHLIVEPYKEGMPVPDTYKFNGQEFKITVRGTEEIPLEWGGKLVFINSIVGGSIDARFLPAIMKGIMSRMEQGPLTGSYARDVRVIVYDGKMHPVDSNEISFMLAGRNAFSEAFKNAGPKILEPIYDVEVFVPSDRMGDVMGDLQGRRAMIMGMSSEKGFEKLVAKVPLKEMSSYSTALSSLTGGRASFIMKFSSYELVPADVQDKLMKDFEAKQVEE